MNLGEIIVAVVGGLAGILSAWVTAHAERVSKRVDALEERLAQTERRTAALAERIDHHTETSEE